MSEDSYTTDERVIVRGLFRYLEDVLPARVERYCVRLRRSPKSSASSQIMLHFTSETGPSDRLLVYAHRRVGYGIDMHFVPAFGSNGKDPAHSRRKRLIDERSSLLAHTLGVQKYSNDYDLHRNHRKYLSHTVHSRKGVYLRINEDVAHWDRLGFREEIADAFVSFAEKAVAYVKACDAMTIPS